MKEFMRKKGKRIVAILLTIMMVNSVMDYSGIRTVSAKANESQSGSTLMDSTSPLTLTFGKNMNTRYVITSTGYRIGTGAETPYTGDYIFEMSSDYQYNNLTVESGTHNITLNNCTLTDSVPLYIEKGAAVNLTLKGTNTLTGAGSNAGIAVPQGAELVITKDSDGAVLNAVGNGCAGIGGTYYDNISGSHEDYMSSCGSVTIEGGIINATGGNYGAGIGSVNIDTDSSTAGLCDGGNITIKGGQVTAQGGKGAAGIGGGAYQSGGIITITGGTVKSTGGSNGAGIGGGNSYGVNVSGGSITISGGDVTAIGTDAGCGIGGGRNATNHGTLSSGAGTPWIKASSGTGQAVGADTTAFHGVVETGNDDRVYGNYSIDSNLEIPSGKTMTLSEGAKLTLADKVILTINGSLDYSATGASFINHGILAGSGTFNPLLPLSITGSNGETEFTTSYDVSTLFTIPETAGTATCTIGTGGTGEGTIGDDGKTLTITKAGTFPVTVTTEETSFYASATQTATLTVKNQTIEDSSITVTAYSNSYDGTTHDAVTVEGVPAGLTATYAESTDGNIPEDAAFQGTCPQVRNVSDTGKTYYVRISGDNYDTWTSSLSGAVSITPITLRVICNFRAAGKTYDGTTTVGSGELDTTSFNFDPTIYDWGLVDVSFDNFAYASANAGATTINFDMALSLSGDATGNYVLADDSKKGSTYTTISQAELTVSLKEDVICQLGDAMPQLTMENLNIIGFKHNETIDNAGIDRTGLDFAFHPTDTSAMTDAGTVTISGLTSRNYSFTYTPGSFKVTKKEFASATPYTIAGNHNGKTGDDCWYNGTITVTPTTDAGDFKYISVSTDGGITYSPWATSADISTETGNTAKDVKVRLSTTASDAGIFVESGDTVKSNLEGFSYRLDTIAPAFPATPADTYGIHVSNSWWRDIFHTITFGSFFKETQTVSVHSDEAGSGIAATYFYKEKVADTTDYTLRDGAYLNNLSQDRWSTSCTVAPNGSYVVYAYTVDKAGNQSDYVCTTGLVIDNNAPVISSAQLENFDDVSANVVVTASDLGSGVKNYYVYCTDTQPAPEDLNPEYIKTNSTQSGTSGVLAVTGLSANTEYSYFVVVEDYAGNISEFIRAYFTTKQTQPKNVEAPEFASSYAYGTNIGQMVLTGGSAKKSDGITELTGTWTFAAEDVSDYPEVGTGKQYVITFTPDDHAYAGVEKTITPVIDPAKPAVRLQNSTDNTYTGLAFTIGTAKVEGASFTGAENPSGAVTYDYFIDAACAMKTTNANSGAVSDGAAPVNAGTYYVKAVIAAEGNYMTATSEAAVLEIKKAAPTLTMQGSISKVYDNSTNITIPKNTTNGYMSSIDRTPDFTFYTDADCTVKTTVAEHGAASQGAAPKNAGIYYVKASYEEGNNYIGVVSTGYMTFTIDKMEQVITGTQSYNKSVGDETFVLDAVTTGDGVLTYEVTSGSDKVSVDSLGTVTLHHVGTATIAITAGETAIYHGKVMDVTINIGATTPVMKENPIAGVITYGDTLGASHLDGGIVVISETNDTELTGTFSWKNDDVKPTVADSNHTEYEVTFTPDSSDYNSVTGKVKLTVNKAGDAPNQPESKLKPAYTVSTVGAVSLPEGWVWDEADSSKVLTENVDVTARAVYKGLDADNYENTTVEVTITRQACTHPNGFTSEITKQPTTTEEGIMTYTCSICGHSYTKSIDKLPSDDNGKEEKPFIKGDSEKEGWDEIKDQVDKSENGDAITVEMNGTSILPGEIIASIQNKDITLVIDMGDGISWIINGKDVTGTELSDIDLKVSKDTQVIPVDVVNAIAGEKYSMQISLAYEGEFGFQATLSINMEEKNAGYYANLFYYNASTGKLEFMNAGQIAADGSVELTFSHASDYTIVVSDLIMDGSQDTNQGNETQPGQNQGASSQTGDSNKMWRYIWMLVLGGIIIIIGFGNVMIKKKRK